MNESRRLTAHWLLVALIVAGAVVAAASLSFLCDDAFITFRHIANARAGHGLVWNAPPFEPVEGYTCFLWAIVLWATWSWFGIEPPDAANVLSIGAGALMLLGLAVTARRLGGIGRRDGARGDLVVATGALLVVASNRTFLTWLTSGLETSLLNLATVTWTLLAFGAREQRSTRWWAAWSAAAAVAALTRPDGVLLVAATAACGIVAAARGERSWRAMLAGLSPLAAVAAQIAWRRWFYGEWVPNTFFAKVSSPWPEAGLRYFACFALENGAWLWPLVGIAWLVAAVRRGTSGAIRARDHLPAVAAAATITAGASYYVLVVGGDHFEYRVLSHLVPLGAFACIALAVRTARGAAWPLAVIAALLLGNGAGWLHLALTHDSFLGLGLRATSPHAPALLRSMARWYDRQQAWLSLRYVGLRREHHRAVFDLYRANYPHRLTVGDAGAFPILATGAIGLPGWSLPECAIVDEFGLADWVIARSPVAFDEPMTAERLRPAVEASDRDHDGYLTATELAEAIRTAIGQDPKSVTHMWVIEYLVSICATRRPDAVTIDEAVAMHEFVQVGRMMAHERRPPPGYVEAFDPNVTVQSGVVTVRPRAAPMTAERIRAIEADWRSRVRAQ